jgi:hypothetical protein
LGPSFRPVKGDVGGNIDKLRKTLERRSEKRTIQQLVLSEQVNGNRIDLNGASTALLWYSRFHEQLSEMSILAMLICNVTLY